MLASIALLTLAAPAPDLLAGCTALRYSKGWQYECDDLVAQVMDEVRISPDARRGMEAGAAAGFGPEVERSEVRLGVSGETVKAVRLTDVDRTRTVFLVPLELPHGERLVVCHTGGSGARCGPVVELLARAGWHEGPVGGAVAVKQQTLTFAGREVTIEQGCVGESLANGGRVQCGPDFFAAWTVVLDEPTAKRALEAMLAEAIATLERQGVQTRRMDVPCAIAGVATRCVRLRGIAERQPFVFVVGAADVGGWTLASCVAPLAFTDKPCRIVFAEP